MVNPRDGILDRLRSQARGGEIHPSAWRSRRHFNDLAARFAAALEKVHGEPVITESFDAALDRLGELLGSLGARKVVVNDEPPFHDLDLAARWGQIEWYIVGRTAGDLRTFCASADVGLSSADAVLAETGSLVVSSGPGRSRLATLLPPVHVALVPISCLTTDLFTWIAARQGSLPASVTIVSGPSKTGDIEQIMAIGVHGPKRFIVILYEG
jgi:L-lactate utilization protein LutC